MDPALEHRAALAQKLSHKAYLSQSLFLITLFLSQGDYKAIIWLHSDFHSSHSEFLQYFVSKVRR